MSKRGVVRAQTFLVGKGMKGEIRAQSTSDAADVPYVE